MVLLTFLLHAEKVSELYSSWSRYSLSDDNPNMSYERVGNGQLDVTA